MMVHCVIEVVAMSINLSIVYELELVLCGLLVLSFELLNDQWHSLGRDQLLFVISMRMKEK